MLARRFTGSTALLALLFACGESEAPRAARPTPPAEIQPLAGSYDVAGTTVDKATGARRDVSGRVMLKVDGDRYRATFNLATTITQGGAPQKAELVGRGEGSVNGRSLAGTAETQLIIAAVPGVDAGFSMMPRTFTARIVNESTASFAPDGGVTIKINSEAAPGESNYVATHTTLRGHKLPPIGISALDE